MIPILAQFYEAFEVFGVDLKVENVQGSHGCGIIGSVFELILDIFD